MARLDYILKLMASEDADAMKLTVGRPAELVFGRTSRPLDIPPFKEEQLVDFVREISTAADLEALRIDGIARIHYEFQGNFFACDIARKRGQLQATFKALGADEGTVPRESPAKEVVDTLPEVDDVLGAAGLSEFEFAPPPPRPTGREPLEVPLLGVDDHTDDLTRPSLVGETFDEAGAEVAPPRSRSTEQPISGPSMDMARVRQRRGPPGTGGLKPRAQIEYTRSEATTPPDYGRKLNREEFDRLLRWMVEQDATDLHITPKFPPTLRVDNLFQPSQGRIFEPGEIEKVIYSILGDKERRELEERSATDLSYEIEGVGRFRINVFKQLYGTSAAVRHVRSAIESLEALNLPPELSWLTGQETGLVLFTGPTGSGKSTTMAAIIEQMNLSRQLHILTLEAPIEFLFQNAKSLIQQREVGVHTPTFLDGLRDALRENPDVIMVGELRDLDTVSMAVSAGETGHLIMATMHANTTVNAVSRLIDVFPDTQKAGARAMISDVLKAVVNLRLLRHSSGRGLVPSVEFLKINNAVATLIRDNKLHQVRQVITTSSGEGMWPFERHLVELFKRGEVDYEVAYQAAPDKKIFEQYAATWQKEREASRKSRRR